jgi:hypothetical protein
MRHSWLELLDRNGYLQLVWLHHKAQDISIEEAKNDLTETFARCGLAEEWAAAKADPANDAEERRRVAFLERQRKEHAIKLKPATASCFPAGTRVFTPSGCFPIENLRRGQIVLSWDTCRASLVEGVVTSFRKGGDAQIMIVRLERGLVFRVTPHHTILTSTGWKCVGKLTLGDVVSVLPPAAIVPEMHRVMALDAGPVQPVFNLHTTGPHSFIADGVVAHNFTELRWLRTWAHRLFVDPFHARVPGGVEALDSSGVN